MKGDARLTFGVWGSAFRVSRLAWKTDRAKANRRYGEVVPTAFEDEEDDEYEDDGVALGWRSLITFGYFR